MLGGKSAFFLAISLNCSNAVDGKGIKVLFPQLFLSWWCWSLPFGALINHVDREREGIPELSKQVHMGYGLVYVTEIVLHANIIRELKKLTSKNSIISRNLAKIKFVWTWAT